MNHAKILEHTTTGEREAVHTAIMNGEMGPFEFHLHAAVVIGYRAGLVIRNRETLERDVRMDCIRHTSSMADARAAYAFVMGDKTDEI